MKSIIILSILLCSLNSLAQDRPLAEYAYSVAKADGHKNPKLLVGLLEVESRLGTAKGYRVVKQQSSSTLSRFYGVGQLTLGAAKAVMRVHPTLWEQLDTRTDEELIARLITDDRFNIQIASKYLLMMGVNRSSYHGITSYQLGPGGAKSVDAKSHPYTLKVKLMADKIEVDPSND